MNFENISTFTYQKTLLERLLLLVFKLIESLQCFLNGELNFLLTERECELYTAYLKIYSHPTHIKNIDEFGF